MSLSMNLTWANLDLKAWNPPSPDVPLNPAVLLKLYIYGYLNLIQSSRRLEKETQRNVELMWLVGRLTPDLKP